MRVVPLYEVFDGVRYRLNDRPDGTPLSEYANKQRRYAAVKEDMSHIQTAIDEQWRYLNGMEKAFPANDDE